MRNRPFTALHPQDVEYGKLIGRDYACYSQDCWILFRAVSAAQTAPDRATFMRARRRFNAALEYAKRWSDYPWHTFAAWERIMEVNNRRTYTPAQRAAYEQRRARYADAIHNAAIATRR
jgi:hypothetical protein